MKYCIVHIFSSSQSISHFIQSILHYSAVHGDALITRAIILGSKKCFYDNQHLRCKSIMQYTDSIDIHKWFWVCWLGIAVLFISTPLPSHMNKTMYSAHIQELQCERRWQPSFGSSKIKLKLSPEKLIPDLVLQKNKFQFRFQFWLCKSDPVPIEFLLTQNSWNLTVNIQFKSLFLFLKKNPCFSKTSNPVPIPHLNRTRNPFLGPKIRSPFMFWFPKSDLAPVQFLLTRTSNSKLPNSCHALQQH